MRLKSVFVQLVAVATLGGLVQAHAETRQLVGTAGYLSEWEVRGALTENVSATGSEFFGPVTWKHIGVCSANGPEEKRGVIKAQINRSGRIPRIEATVSLEKAQCTFNGNFSERTSVVMDCSDAKGVPLTFSIGNP
jgi:hypothetical protein